MCFLDGFGFSFFFAFLLVVVTSSGRLLLRGLVLVRFLVSSEIWVVLTAFRAVLGGGELRVDVRLVVAGLFLLKMLVIILLVISL